jgi:hypothetical protein
METRAQSRRNLQIGLLVLLGIVLVALSCVHLFV